MACTWEALQNQGRDREDPQGSSSNKQLLKGLIKAGAAVVCLSRLTSFPKFFNLYTATLVSPSHPPTDSRVPNISNLLWCFLRQYVILFFKWDVLLLWRSRIFSTAFSITFPIERVMLGDIQSKDQLLTVQPFWNSNKYTKNTSTCCLTPPLTHL